MAFQIREEALDDGDRGGWENPTACSICIWGRRRHAGEALPETLATGVGLRACNRGRERRIWPEGREARIVGISRACCAVPEIAGIGRRGRRRRRR